MAPIIHTTAYSPPTSGLYRPSKLILASTAARHVIYLCYVFTGEGVLAFLLLSKYPHFWYAFLAIKAAIKMQAHIFIWLLSRSI